MKAPLLKLSTEMGHFKSNTGDIPSESRKIREERNHSSSISVSSFNSCSRGKIRLSPESSTINTHRFSVYEKKRASVLPKINKKLKLRNINNENIKKLLTLESYDDEDKENQDCMNTIENCKTFRENTSISLKLKGKKKSSSALLINKTKGIFENQKLNNRIQNHYILQNVKNLAENNLRKTLGYFGECSNKKYKFGRFQALLERQKQKNSDLLRSVKEKQIENELILKNYVAKLIGENLD